MLPKYININEISFYHVSTGAFEALLNNTNTQPTPTFTLVGDVATSMFERLELSSGIDHKFANGILVLKDRGDIIGKLNPSGKDIIKISIAPDPLTTTEGESEGLETYYVVSETEYSNAATDRKYSKLITFKLLSINFYKNLKAINTNTLSADLSVLKYGTIDYSNKIFDKICEDVTFIFQPSEFDTTTQYYLKNKNLIFPNNRITDDSPFAHLEYMSKYAMGDNLFPSFYVYEDVNTFLNFVNILPTEPIEHPTTYIVGNINTFPGREVPFELVSIKNFSFSRLISGGALSSYYECVYPDFSNYYFDYLGNKSFVRKNIEFDITELNTGFNNLSEDYDRGISYTFADTPLEFSSFTCNETDPETGQCLSGVTTSFSIQQSYPAYIPMKRFVDDKPYGYYDSSYLNTNYDPSFNNFLNIDSTKTTDKLYQTMFDIFPFTDDDLTEDNSPGITNSIGMVRKIIEILNLNESAKKIYRKKIELKEKFNVFKYVLCCLLGDDEDANTIDAVVKYHSVLTNSTDTKHPVYLYTFKQIEYIPLDFNIFFNSIDTNLSGFTLIQGSSTALRGVTMSGITLDLSKYDSFYWPTGIVTTQFNINLGMAGLAAGLTRSNIHFLVAGLKDGVTGYCFNTNETMNFHVNVPVDNPGSAIDPNFTYFSNGLTLGATGFFYGGSGYDLSLKQLILRQIGSGGIVTDTFALNDYRIMPIGCIKQNWSLDNANEFLAGQSQLTTTKCNIRSREHITKIFRKDLKNIKGISGLTYTCVGVTAIADGRTSNFIICPNTNYYTFDVQNSIDGFCGIECELSDNKNPIVGFTASPQSDPFKFIRPYPIGYT